MEILAVAVIVLVVGGFIYKKRKARAGKPQGTGSFDRGLNPPTQER